MSLGKTCGMALISIIFIGLSGCAGNPTNGETSMYLPPSDTMNRAPGAAYAGDGMNIDKPMPSRPEWKPLQFYYKHCTQVDTRVYYSKTSYNCMGPH